MVSAAKLAAVATLASESYLGKAGKERIGIGPVYEQVESVLAIEKKQPIRIGFNNQTYMLVSIASLIGIGIVWAMNRRW